MMGPEGPRPAPLTIRWIALRKELALNFEAAIANYCEGLSARPIPYGEYCDQLALLCMVKCEAVLTADERWQAERKIHAKKAFRKRLGGTDR